MEAVFKIAAVSIISVSLISMIKGKNPNGALALSLICVVLIGSFLVPRMKEVYDRCISIAGKSVLDKSFYAPLLKTVCIAIVCRIAAEVCKDNGEKALGVQVELTGVTAGVLCSLPLLEKIFEMIGAL